MASRVTLAEAAAIGGCDVERLRQALIPIGFRFCEDIPNPQKEELDKRPQWLLAVPEDKIFNFDVRPVIEASGDPLQVIVKKFGELKDGEILCIINSFVPYPLINLLAKDSLAFTIENNPAEHHTWFLKRTPDANQKTKKTADVKVIMDDEKSFAAALAGFDEAKVKRIDVRHLSMPAPMQTILDALADLPKNDALYVYHKKVPVYLLQELSDQHFNVHVLNLGEGEVRLFVYPNN
jgi:uncharacterized protein (DUF2249 family)